MCALFCIETTQEKQYNAGMGFQIIKYDDTKPIGKNWQNITAIPGGEVCTVFLSGAGIAPGESMQKVGHIIAQDYLDGLTDVGNYIVGYTFDNPNGVKAAREIQYDKYNQNILGVKTNTPDELRLGNNCFNLYITENNIDRVFRRIVIPVLQENAKKFTHIINKVLHRNVIEKNNINFTYIVDGDIAKIKPIIKQKLESVAKQLQYTPDEIFRLSQRIYPYEKYFEPAYLDKLFDAILLPRITDNTGKRLPLDLVQRQIRKINLMAHCHGAYVALMLHERLQNKMRDLGYNNLEIKKVLSQLLVVALNPDCPLGTTNSPFITFTSGYDIYARSDYTKRAGNYITDFTRKFPEEIPNGFVGKSAGNVFFVKNRFKSLDLFDIIPSTQEHHNIRTNQTDHTNNGKMLMGLMHNVVQSGVRNSGAQKSGFTPLPDIDELILDGKNDEQIKEIFQTMKRNGNKFLKSVYEHARKIVSARKRTSIIPQKQNDK